LDLTGYWLDVDGRLYGGSESKSMAVDVPVTAAVDCTVRRPASAAALPVARNFMGSRCTSTTSTASASSNVDNDDDDDVTSSPDDVMRFIESPV